MGGASGVVLRWDRWGAERGGRVAEVRERRSAGSTSMEYPCYRPKGGERVGGVERVRGRAGLGGRGGGHKFLGGAKELAKSSFRSLLPAAERPSPLGVRDAKGMLICHLEPLEAEPGLLGLLRGGKIHESHGHLSRRQTDLRKTVEIPAGFAFFLLFPMISLLMFGGIDCWIFSDFL